MRENFPNQQGGSWYSNMLGDVSSRGYLQDDRDYLQPAHNWILSIAAGTPGSEYQSSSTARVRFGLASGALGEGVHAFGPGNRAVLEAPYHEWWYDEYAVDLSTGRSSESLQHTGWLGAALNGPYKMLWTSNAPESITNPGFETDVTSGWLFRSFAPASGTLTRDVTTAAVGNASSKVHVGAVSSVDWYVNFTSAGELNVFAGSSYSATFWCKASAPRILHLQAGNSRGNAYVAVDTTWRRYQAVLQPSLSMSAGLAFFLGTQAGDVWFDDVHFQPGATSVWRRDFQYGSVLVNPTELALDVALETPFRRILGVHASAVNDGALSATLRLPPYDALFLLRAEIDGARPAAVQDLRLAP